MKKALFFMTFFALTVYVQSQTVTDIDNNVYHTVTIGTQVWMVENLKTTKYNDDISIPNCYTYNNTTNADTINLYGRLYNWHTVNSRLCPIGWHVPSDAEWTILTSYLGGISIAGAKLKETGTTHWNSPNTGATNESGFTALPSGYYFVDGKFYSIGSLGFWWSSTEDPAHAGSSAWCWFLSSGNNISRVSYGMNNGLSVRCLKDNTSSINITNADKIEIYFNSTNDKLYLKNINSENSILYIFNLQGEQILYKKNVISFIDISNLKNGVYIVKIIDSGKIKMAKFIKE